MNQNAPANNLDRASLIQIDDEDAPYTNPGTDPNDTDLSRADFLDLDDGLGVKTSVMVKSERNVFLGEGDTLHKATNLGQVEATYDAETAFRSFRQACGIDWTYSIHPAPHPTIPGALVANKNWITRDDHVAEGKAKAWGPFSDGYGLTQLSAIDRLGGVLIREQCKVKSMLAFDEGGSVAVTASRAGFERELPSGGKAQSLTTIVDSKDGSYSLRGAEHVIDPICRNTLAWALSGDASRTWRMPHTRNVNERLEELVTMLSKGSTYADALVDRLFAHDSTKIHLDKVVSFFRKIRAVDEAEISAKAKANRVKLVERDVEILKNAPGAMFNAASSTTSFYGLDQWGSFASTHLLGSKATREDEGKLLEYTVLGNGARWQNNVLSQVDSWWQEESKGDVKLQTVSLS